MWLWPILVIVVIVLLIQFVSKSSRNFGNSGAGAESRHVDTPRPESALDILKKRYAAGEITKEEFESMKKDIA